MERAEVMVAVTGLLRAFVRAVSAGCLSLGILLLQGVLAIMLDAQAHDSHLDRQRRSYFLRPDMLYPDEGQWQFMKEVAHDAAFIHLLRLDVATFRLIMDSCDPDEVAWRAGWTDRQRINRRSGPANLLQADDCVAAALVYLSSTCANKHLELLFGVTHTLMCEAIDTGLHLLAGALERIPDASVQFPSFAYMSILAQAVVETYGEPPIPTQMFGFVDGFRLVVENSGDADVQRLWYNGSVKLENSHNVVLLLMDGTVAWANVNQPGNFSDYAASLPLFAKLRRELPPGQRYSVAGDDAFGSFNTNTFMATKRYAPEAHVDASPQQRREWEKWQKSVRQGVEWGIHTLTSTWARLRVPMTSDGRRRRLLIETAIHLHNLIARRMDHRSQLKTVYQEGLLRARGAAVW
jgi:hypothetical protein